MKYSDLVKFEPIESVIQLEQADSPEAVRQLVQTFVISDRMAEQLCDLVIPNMQFEKPFDNKGVLIDGNYGTGRSHLLTLISGLAEHAEMASVVKNKDVAKAAKAIAGQARTAHDRPPAGRSIAPRPGGARGARYSRRGIDRPPMAVGGFTIPSRRGATKSALRCGWGRACAGIRASG